MTQKNNTWYARQNNENHTIRIADREEKKNRATCKICKMIYNICPIMHNRGSRRRGEK